MPLHVSSTVVLIIRKSKLYYTASGIVTPVGGRPVRRLREMYGQQNIKKIQNEVNVRHTVVGYRQALLTLVLYLEFYYTRSRQCGISGFHREVDVNSVLLGYYATRNGNSLPTFRSNISVPSILDR